MKKLNMIKTILSFLSVMILGGQIFAIDRRDGSFSRPELSDETEEKDSFKRPTNPRFSSEQSSEQSRGHRQFSSPQDSGGFGSQMRPIRQGSQDSGENQDETTEPDSSKHSADASLMVKKNMRQNNQKQQQTAKFIGASAIIGHQDSDGNDGNNSGDNDQGNDENNGDNTPATTPTDTPTTDMITPTQPATPTVVPATTPTDTSTTSPADITTQGTDSTNVPTTNPTANATSGNGSDNNVVPSVVDATDTQGPVLDSIAQELGDVPMAPAPTPPSPTPVDDQTSIKAAALVADETVTPVKLDEPSAVKSLQPTSQKAFVNTKNNGNPINSITLEIPTEPAIIPFEEPVDQKDQKVEIQKKQKKKYCGEQGAPADCKRKK